MKTKTPKVDRTAGIGFAALLDGIERRHSTAVRLLMGVDAMLQAAAKQCNPELAQILNERAEDIKAFMNSPG